MPPSPPDRPAAEVDALESALAAIAPGSVTTAARPISAADAARLFPEELQAIARAVPRRRDEFASGRALLRQLLGADVTIPVGVDRAPVLPPGVVASLAHDRDLAVAAMSRDPLVRAIGIDVEPDEPLPPEMARVILRPDEAGLDAHLAFVLKEAAYKAWSRMGGRLLDHHEMHVALEDPSAAGTGAYTARALDGPVELSGRWASVAGRHISLVVVGADPRARVGRGLSKPSSNS